MNAWRIARLPIVCARSIGLGRNTLRRGFDRIEIAAAVTAIVLTIAALPLALAAGTAVHRSSVSLSVEQLASSHRTSATLIEDAPAGGLDSGLTQVTALGRWRTPNGTSHTDQVYAPIGARAGTSVPVWINNASGQQVNQPLTADQAYWRGILAVTAVMLGVLALLYSAFLLVRHLLNRKRYAAWDAEWCNVEPEWTHRRR